MYVLFRLLVLFFSSVRGEVIQCFVGGIVKYDTGNDSITEMQKQYCNELVKDLFGILLTDRKDYWRLIFNIEIEMTKNAGLKPIQNEEEFHETHSTIVEYWDDIVRSGTDMHRLKFHSKLLTLHRDFYQFTAEELLVFLKSSYSVVGIYYLTNNLLIASSVASDTYSVLQIFKDVLQNTNNSDINIMEFVMWQILTYIALLDIPDFRKKTSSRCRIVSQYRDLHRKLNELHSNGNNYPCSYLFMFRNVLLDRKQFSDVHQWHNYSTLVNDGKIRDCESHSDNNKIQIYMDIVSSIYDPETEFVKGYTSFKHLINALKIPVLTSEDRLINYKATTLAMKKISDCVHEDVVWLEYDNNCLCNTLKTNRENDRDLDNILTKLTYMQVYEMTNDNFEFIPDYRNNDETINENKLHMIVTMGLDNIDNNVDLSSKRVKIINTTIEILTSYIEKLQETNPKIYTKNVGITDKKEYFRELMRAHKWLAELHGVLCTDSNNKPEIETHQEALETSLTIAITLQRRYNFDDDHLEFLYYKKICKDSQISYSWERHYKADGWVQNSASNSNVNNRDSIFLQGHECGGVSKFLGVNNQFIHQADVNILLFKHLIMTHNMNNRIENYVQNALSHWVITSEDRVRNLQAHDLYSMFFVWENYRIVKEQEDS